MEGEQALPMQAGTGGARNLTQYRAGVRERPIGLVGEVAAALDGRSVRLGQRLPRRLASGPC